jgi:hypothetical protein
MAKEPEFWLRSQFGLQVLDIFAKYCKAQKKRLHLLAQAI